MAQKSSKETALAQIFGGKDDELSLRRSQNPKLESSMDSGLKVIPCERYKFYDRKLIVKTGLHVSKMIKLSRNKCKTALERYFKTLGTRTTTEETKTTNLQ